MDVRMVVEIVFGLVLAVVNGMLIWTWQQTREELRFLKENRCINCEKQLADKASRTRVQELERRVEKIEAIGLTERFMEDLRRTLAKIDDKLAENNRFMGRVEESLKKIDQLDTRVTDHLEGHE